MLALLCCVEPGYKTTRVGHGVGKVLRPNPPHNTRTRGDLSEAALGSAATGQDLHW